MSDEEEYSEEEEEVAEVKKPEPRAEEPSGGAAEFIKKQDQKKSELDEQLKEYIQEWRKQRAKEEDELRKLKEKQAKRKTIRQQEEKRLGEKKRQEEERRMREAEEAKRLANEAKLKRIEEAERKRQLMLQAQKASLTGKNFFQKSSAKFDEPGSARQELTKTKEQLEEEKKLSLSFRIKPMDLTGLSAETLKNKAKELWEQIVRLETEKYDFEERQKRQDYDLKELKERQKQQLRHKAQKRGLDPEALTGKYPPKLQVASKYERRVDTRTYDEKKKLYDGGFENIDKENVDKSWAETIKAFDQRQKTKLPKWFGERPGKKKGEPESPDEEPVEAAIPETFDDLEEPNFEEEEVEEEEEEEEKEEEEEEE